MWYEDETHFEENVKVVPVEMVMITPSIVRAVKRWGGKIKDKEFEKDPNPAPTPLRTNLKDNEIFEGNPIAVKQVGDYYSIIDGRHRFASLLARGFKNVSVEIVSTS